MSIFSFVNTESIKKENKSILFVLGTIISYKYIE